VTFVHGDLTQKDQVVDALRKHGIKAVLHVASPDPNSPNRQLLFNVNVTGTRNLIAACVEVGVKTLVYTSTASVVWEGAGQENVDESFPYPRSFRDPYAETKAQAEQEVMQAAAKHKAAGLVTISLRPHAIFGPYDIMVPTSVEVARSKRNRFIIGDGTNVVDWTYVGNVVHSHMLALATAQREGAASRANGRTYFITNNEPLPFWEFMNWIWLGMGYDTAVRRLPYGLILNVARVYEAILAVVQATCRRGSPPVRPTFSVSRLQIAGTPHWYNTSAARRDLGYEPVWTLKEGVYLTLSAMQHIRCDFPSQRALALAREGGLVAAKLVHDPEARRTAAKAEHVDEGTM
jgi:nucleoside-diphosphate-sugar epimerase